MLARWPIRRKLVLGGALLVLIVVLLAVGGFQGVYAYRGLVRAISLRAAELPKATALVHSTGELRYVWKQEQSLQLYFSERALRRQLDEHAFRMALLQVRSDLVAYKEQLTEDTEDVSHWIGDKRKERETVEQMEAAIARVEQLTESRDWLTRQFPDDVVTQELDRLYDLAAALPGHLYSRMQALRDAVRVKYRSLIVLVWSTAILAVVLLGLLGSAFYRWIFRPLRIIIDGSRRVAQGDYHYRIHLVSRDEMGELAQAMNDMTASFCQVRDDLDRQVRIRTRQAVQSEKMASVGFLAAGVAHEINNPLASVALCAESIESRIEELREESDSFDQWDELDTVERYLRTIQEEAFRCKGITERLLDYSRKGTSERSKQDLGELAAGVIEMVQHMARSQKKTLRLECNEPVIAHVNGQEIKQVILNLVTNALQSTDEGGVVDVVVTREAAQAQIIVTDDGCGMTEEVRGHLFDPFFTQRRVGQGTGLGLSITYRIIEDHGGSIEALSDGPGRGSQFIVNLPVDYQPSARNAHEHEGNQEVAKVA